jgi:D-alanine--poly(phosphoribitol) ligase subunit 1
LVSKNDIEFIEAGLSKALAIGFPTNRMPIKVLNEQGFECKPLEKGELVVFGPAVGQGYLTTQPNDGFTEINGQRAFKTGDIGYVDNNGRLNIVGRSANLIKISGFRIDPREVEFWLERICVGSNACILLSQDPGMPPSLVGVIGGGDSTTLLASEIRHQLRTHVPEYMIPRNFKFFESLPLNANGKIDRESVRKLIANE